MVLFFWNVEIPYVITDKDGEGDFPMRSLSIVDVYLLLHSF